MGKRTINRKFAVTLLLSSILSACSGGGSDGAVLQATDASGAVTISAGSNCDAVYSNAPVTQATGTDPLLAGQWNLTATGQSGSTPGEDIRIADAWRITRGAGVVVAVLDDAVDILHPDLRPNIARGSKTYRLGNHSGMPLPCSLAEDDHGTKVAGVIAARANNGIGGSGVAPEAGIVALDILSNRTATNLFDALTYDNSRISIYNNSWGSASGGAVRPVIPLYDDAINLGIDYGRRTLGSIFVFAAGNGGHYDNSNYDGFLTGRGIIPVCQIDAAGKKTQASEPGANILLCAPVSSSGGGITTTTIGGGYTEKFSGTSAAAPTISGVAALMLSVRPELTWRDVQQILARTARKNDPYDPAWRPARAGGFVHPFYGYGVVDAASAVRTAQTWTSIGGSSSLRTCDSGTITANSTIPDTGGSVPLELQFNLNCPSITMVEHVEVVVDIEHNNTGDIRIDLTTPEGYSSRLADARICKTELADPCGKYKNWRFGLKHHLDENPNGTWRMSIRDFLVGNQGNVVSWRLVVYGR